MNQPIPLPLPRTQPGPDRQGAAAVEFAVCLPILVMLVFGSIEASSMIFLKQSLNVAAYEAIRETVRSGNENADGDARARLILDARGVKDYAIQFPNGESESLNRGEEIIAQVTAPSGSNSPLLGQFISNRVITSRVVMIKQ